MIKKITAGFLGMMMLASPSYASANPNIVIDSKPLETDVAPVIENGRVLVPFRAIFENLGLQVDWNDNLQIATAYNDSTNVAIKMNGGYGSINGELKALETPGHIVNGRAMVPLRFVSEAFGNEVQWNGATKTVSIKSGFKNYAYTSELPTVGSLDRLRLILDYAGRFDQGPIYLMRENMVADAKVAAVAPTAQVASGNGSFSNTNVQVQGVDEADMVKTDGNYIYQLRDKDLQITKATEGKMSKGATISFESSFAPQEFYLYQKQLVVIGSLNSYGTPDYISARTIMPASTPKTQVRFYNIQNPESPKMVRRFETEGWYLTSRVTGGSLYFVANKPLYRNGMIQESMLPEFYDSVSNKKERIAVGTLRYFPDAVESNFLLTYGFDLNSPSGSPSKNAYLGSGNQIYASTGNLYIAAEQYRYRIKPDSLVPEYTRSTNMYRFALVNKEVRFTAKGMVPGNLLNQFSMDEYNGNLRVATTVGNTWDTGDSASKNNVYVLDPSMKIMGRLEGLAPTERIYSTRFIGSRLYMVTYRQTDPFYVINLSDPSNPKVMGYLKIPGFSEYLHPLNNNTIIGFGRETVETDGRVVPAGLKIGVFDVTDVNHPIEKSKMVIGDSGTYSELLNNHKALLAMNNQGLYGFPITVYEKNGDYQKMKFQGGYVLSITADKGIQIKGTATNLTDSDIQNIEKMGYAPGKEVRRLIQIGDYIYTLADEGIKSYSIEPWGTKESYTFGK